MRYRGSSKRTTEDAAEAKKFLKLLEIFTFRGYTMVDTAKLTKISYKCLKDNILNAESDIPYVSKGVKPMFDFDIESLPFSDTAKFLPNRDDVDLIRSNVNTISDIEKVAELLNISKFAVEMMSRGKDPRAEERDGMGYNYHLKAEHYFQIILNRHKLMC